MPYLAIILATFCYAYGNLTLKLSSLQRFELLSFRSIIPLVFALILIKFNFRDIFREYDKKLLIVAFLQPLRLFLFISGITLAPIHEATIIGLSWPLLSTFILHFLGYEKSYRNIVYALIGLLGIIIIFQNYSFNINNSSFIGLVCAFASALLYACITIFYKFKLTTVNPNLIIINDNILFGVLGIPIIFSVAHNYPTSEFITAVNYGFCTGFLGFYLFYRALKEIPASIASIFCYFEIVFVCLLGYFLIGEEINLNTFLGILLIILSIIFSKINYPLKEKITSIFIKITKV